MAHVISFSSPIANLLSLLVHSKKSVDVRREELLTAVSGPLLKFAEKHCSEMVMNNASLLLFICIINHAKGKSDLLL